MKHSHTYSVLFVMILTSLFMGACQQDDFYSPQTPVISTEDELSISFCSDPMQQYKVPARSSDPKEDAEKAIHQLYIFFFAPDGSYLTGAYLTGYQGETGAIEQGGYIAPGQGATLIKIDKALFDNRSDAQSATVYAVANVEPSLFRELDSNNRPKYLQDIIDGSNGSITTPKAALESIVYHPETFIFTTLPETGMPMVGQTTLDLTGVSTPESKRIIELKALMARIDVNIQLNSDISESNLPRMLLTSWTAKNLPTQVAFASTAEGGTTALDESSKTERTSQSTQYISNRQGNIELSFYMFENMQQPTDAAQYPADIEEYHKQRYKPTIANDNAACIEFNTQYTTYNNATYTVKYTLYLGSNHTDNFEVQRNHQYKNNITIKGLTSQEDAGGEFTYDARVNIEEQGNKYYISILRERNHDAHFCVTPMDVYLFNENANPSMTIEFENGTDLDKNGKPWIRMEKIPAENMQAGTLPNGMTTNDHLIAGGNFTAGHGKRKYFTTDLVTNTLAESGKVITINNSRDRVYFYIDENLSDSEDRTAVVKLTYKDDKGTTEPRTLDITQTHFLRVQVYGRTGNRPDYNSPYSDDNDYDDQDGVIYMEQYEEYLDHYDPLDKYDTEQIYTGLPWGLSGQSISDPENYCEGLYYTGIIIEEAAHGIMTLNETPRSAAEYCYNRNKREENGVVYYQRRGGPVSGYTYNTNRKYFLPGIRQMEDALTQYYTTFPEFQGNFYWSSAAGKNSQDWLYPYQDRNRARATKVNTDGSYVESAYGYNYPGGGAALRTQPLRIRAFRSDLEQLQY